jgi:hypothetical protein
MLRADAERVLTANGYKIETFHNKRHDRWTACLISPSGKYDLQTPTASGISEHAAIVNLFCLWTGCTKIREHYAN